MLEIKTGNKTKQELLLTTGELKVFEMWTDGCLVLLRVSVFACGAQKTLAWVGEILWIIVSADWALSIEINQARFSDKQETRINKKLGLECQKSLTFFFFSSNFIFSVHSSSYVLGVQGMQNQSSAVFFPIYPPTINLLKLCTAIMVLKPSLIPLFSISSMTELFQKPTQHWKLIQTIYKDIGVKLKRLFLLLFVNCVQYILLKTHCRTKTSPQFKLSI